MADILRNRNGLSFMLCLEPGLWICGGVYGGKRKDQIKRGQRREESLFGLVFVINFAKYFPGSYF